MGPRARLPGPAPCAGSGCCVPSPVTDSGMASGREQCREDTSVLSHPRQQDASRPTKAPGVHQLCAPLGNRWRVLPAWRTPQAAPTLEDAPATSAFPQTLFVWWKHTIQMLIVINAFITFD